MPVTVNFEDIFIVKKEIKCQIGNIFHTADVLYAFCI